MLRQRGATPTGDEARRLEQARTDWLAGRMTDAEWLEAASAFFVAAFDADPAVRAAEAEIPRFVSYSSEGQMHRMEAAVDEAHAAVRDATVDVMLEELEPRGLFRPKRARGPYR